MSNAKKSDASDEISVAKLQGLEEDKSGNVQLAIEKTMLLNLQKLKEATKVTNMDQRDLDYPVDVSSPLPDLPDTPEQFEESIAVQEEILEEELDDEMVALDDAIDDLSIPDISDDTIAEIGLDDEIDNLDIDIQEENTQTLSTSPSCDEIEVEDAQELDDDPTSGGFILDTEALAQEEENEEEFLNDDGEEITEKRELIRQKRKKALEEKKKRRLQEEKEQEKERLRQLEKDKQSNILSVDELMKKATSSFDINQVENQNESHQWDEGETAPFVAASVAPGATAASMPVRESFLNPASSAAPAQQSHAPHPQMAARTQASPPPSQAQYSQMSSAVYAKPHKWYVAAAINCLVILGEILKSVLPAGVVAFYFFNHYQYQASQKAINHILSGDQFEIEMGLVMLKEHPKMNNIEHYYTLVKNKLNHDLDESWLVQDFDPFKLSQKINELLNYTFIDAEKINLPKMVKEKNEANFIRLSEQYQRFYETELAGNKDKDYLDSLRQANIFLGRKECLKAYDKFWDVQSLGIESVSSQYGKLLSFHCAMESDALKTRKFFEEKMVLYNLKRMQKNIYNQSAREPASVDKTHSDRGRRGSR